METHQTGLLPRLLDCVDVASKRVCCHPEGNRDRPSSPRRYDEFYSHFHVTPETHRAILDGHGDTARREGAKNSPTEAASLGWITLNPKP